MTETITCNVHRKVCDTCDECVAADRDRYWLHSAIDTSSSNVNTHYAAKLVLIERRRCIDIAQEYADQGSWSAALIMSEIGKGPFGD